MVDRDTETLLDQSVGQPTVNTEYIFASPVALTIESKEHYSNCQIWISNGESGYSLKRENTELNFIINTHHLLSCSVWDYIGGLHDRILL